MKNKVIGKSIAFVIMISMVLGITSSPTKFVQAEESYNYAKALQLSMYFYDAGDHVNFGLPQSYSASTLGWGYYQFRLVQL